MATSTSNTTASDDTSFTDEDAKALAALQAKQAQDVQAKQEAARVARKAALAPIAKVLTQKLLDDLTKALNDSLANTQEPDTITLIMGFKQSIAYQGLGLVSLIAAADAPVPVAPTTPIGSNS